MRLHLALTLWIVLTDVMATSAGKGAELKRLDSVLGAQAIPLKRTGKAMPLIYTSAIAHRLANQMTNQNDPAATIAAQLVDILLEALPDDLGALRGVTVQATVAGLIHFEVGDRAITVWLDQILTNSLPSQRWPPVPMAERERQAMLESAAIFEAQYAHARCCSLLRLAHREAFINLETLEALPCDWRLNSFTPLSWLTTSAQLSLNHPADRYLLVQLVDAFDRLSDPSPQRTLASLVRSAQAVSQAFQVFHRTHPLCDHTGQEPALVTAQLGLLMATQRILYWLLADGLHLCPVSEL
ncbi:DALR anticodon-binding domain-containing protein [Stenomitos frigidus]|nr:DALR anticodon-binding domain-containing protein [Stenomitos frigidus]